MSKKKKGCRITDRSMILYGVLINNCAVLLSSWSAKTGHGDYFARDFSLLPLSVLEQPK